MNKLFHYILILTFLLAAAGVMPAAGQVGPDPGPVPQTPNGPPGSWAFLPLIRRNTASYGVTGQVTDQKGNPLSGVKVMNGEGDSTLTDSEGKYGMTVNTGDYSFSPSKTGVGFAPADMELDVEGYVSNLDFTGVTGCTDILVNGGFEASGSWELSGATFSVTQYNSGARSLQLGLLDPDANIPGQSSARSAVYAIPADAKEPILRLWLFTQSITATSKEASLPQLEDNFFGPSADANDRQAVQVLSQSGQVLETVLELQGANNQQWGLVQFNLAKYTGQSIRLGFSVTNDGAGSVSAMFVDDVSLQTCPTLSASESAPSDLNAPEAACTNQVVNSGFETGNGWGIPYTAYSAGYQYKSPYPTTVFAGSWSMRTGIPAYLPWHNRYSYSDAWQMVYIPPTATSADLSMWVKQVSTEAFASSETDEEVNLAESEPLFAPDVLWGQQPLAYDTMYVLILNPYNGAILQTLRAWPARNNDWKLWTWSLLPYRGHNIRIQFGTYNDGWDGVTSMYVDEAYVNVCDGGLPPPPPPPTICPVGYTQRLVNTSFETSNGWYIPTTAYSARYTNSFWHSGVRSMQTGIKNPWHNRYSYSDFGQYTAIPGGIGSTAILKYWVYQGSADWYDKQYLLVLNNWGYWIDTLMWLPGNNTSGWVEVTRNLSSKPYKGVPIRLHFGTYNNGWGGVTTMFVDDVTLCTIP